jgi:hypothetical protein
MKYISYRIYGDYINAEDKEATFTRVRYIAPTKITIMLRLFVPRYGFDLWNNFRNCDIFIREVEEEIV